MTDCRLIFIDGLHPFAGNNGEPITESTRQVAAKRFESCRECPSFKVCEDEKVLDMKLRDRGIDV